MKIKRAISIAFILMSLMCSSVGFSQIAPAADENTSADIHYVKFSQTIPQEFCEAFTIVLADDERSGLGFVGDYTAGFTLNTVSIHKYQSYLKNYRSKKSAQKLFIDFGAIII